MTSRRSAVRVSYVPMIPLPSLRAYAVELLGVALVELFPGVQLVRSSVLDQGFSYEVIFPQSLHPELLDILEEKMRQMFKEGVVFHLMEMMPKNAAAFFENYEQDFLAERALEAPEETLLLIRRDSYADFLPVVPEAFPLEMEPFAFKLYEVKPTEDSSIIFGTAFFEKDELKSWVKTWSKRAKSKDENWLDKLEWSTPEGWLLPNGVEEADRWKKIWSEQLKSKGLGEVMTFGADELQLALAKRFRNGIGEWASGELIQDLCTIVTSKQEALPTLISSLQFIVETVKILEVSVEWIAEFYPSPYSQHKEWKQGVACLKQAASALAVGYEESLLPPSASEPTLTGVVTDRKGGRIKLPWLSVDFSRENEVLIQFSLFGPLMRFLALQAEKRAVT